MANSPGQNETWLSGEPLRTAYEQLSRKHGPHQLSAGNQQLVSNQQASIDDAILLDQHLLTSMQLPA